MRTREIKLTAARTGYKNRQKNRVIIWQKVCKIRRKGNNRGRRRFTAKKLCGEVFNAL